jgi:hypothetical protein
VAAKSAAFPLFFAVRVSRASPENKSQKMGRRVVSDLSGTAMFQSMPGWFQVAHGSSLFSMQDHLPEGEVSNRS